MKTKIILLLSFLFSLVCGGTTEAKRSVDPLILKSDSILSYFMEGKGKELNAFLREDLKSKLPPEVLDGLFGQPETQVREAAKSE